ncbi:hypothetical protein TCAL_03328 [Tigriopus californicus]|uniref:Secreted protein n=2 Tax=Tigriopus californicus TaxID=6832 RepID=A0A553P7G5_TIGCA|nr:hypothetical protein TCAL_03328 [Tigriopus californicus]|eukprot:TCALIF_03328-PA protein Name:"Protein of unknown function" AED:0.16 eAED:0.16 QI:0/0/0.33/0.66/0/0.33/3/389/78
MTILLCSILITDSLAQYEDADPDYPAFDDNDKPFYDDSSDDAYVDKDDGDNHDALKSQPQDTPRSLEEEISVFGLCRR